jgi:hypothetical protein
MFQIPDTKQKPQKLQAPELIAKQWKQTTVAFFDKLL